MTETALNSAKPTALNCTESEAVNPRPEGSSPLPGALLVADLEIFSRDYLLDCDYRMQSPRTIETRRIFIAPYLHPESAVVS